MPKVVEVAPALAGELNAAGQRLGAADAERAEAMIQARAAAVKADSEGVPVAQVARMLGLSRVSVYRLLER